MEETSDVTTHSSTSTPIDETLYGLFDVDENSLLSSYDEHEGDVTNPLTFPKLTWEEEDTAYVYTLIRRNYVNMEDDLSGLIEI
jgi:hypothetical protein